MTTKRTTTKNAAGAALKAAMASLATMPLARLRAEYEQALGTPAGKTKRDHMVKALATRATTGTAAAAATPAAAKPTAPHTRSTKPRDPRLPPAGTTLTRDYKGKVHEIEVLERGFRYDGREWRSLTGIALVITGYKAISGTLFFGIARRKPAAPTTTPDAPAKAPRTAKTPAPKRKRGSR